MPDWKPIEGIQGIDPCVLIDKQGSAYIYWAGNGLRMARLKDNMKELASAPVLIEGLPEGFKEGRLYLKETESITLLFPG